MLASDWEPLNLTNDGFENLLIVVLIETRSKLSCPQIVGWGEHQAAAQIDDYPQLLINIIASWAIADLVMVESV